MSGPKVQHHGLFLPDDGEDFEPQPIAKIFVTRYESTGKIRAPQWFSPDVLREPADIFSRFGGGMYEIEACTADGRFYKRRPLNLPGESKSLAPAEAPSAATAPSAPTTAITPAPGLDPMVALMFQIMQQNTQLLVGVISAIAGRPAPTPPPSSTPAEMMTAIASLAGALRPPPAPPPAPVTPMTEVLGVMNAIDQAAEKRTEAARQAARDAAPEESTAETVKAVAEAALPLLAAAAQGPKVAIGAT